MGRIFGGLFHLLWLLILCHWSLPRAINERAIRRWRPGGSATFYQFSEAMYLYPLVPTGVYTLIFHHFGWASDAFLGWFFLSVVLAVIVTLVVDIGRGLMMALILLGGLLVVGSGYLEVAYKIEIGAHLSQLLRRLQMGFHPDWVLPITVVSALLFGINLVWRRFDSVLTVQGDQLTIHRLGADSLSFQRGGWTFRKRFKDLLEWALGGGSGSLAIIHPVTHAELFVAHHVPGFAKIAARIQEQFAVTDVTHDPGRRDREDEPATVNGGE